MIDLLFLLAIFCFFVAWWHQRGMKDIALRKIRKKCEGLQLQLLDETVQVYRWKIKRNQAGDWVLQRSYQFEFTSLGEERYRGEAVFLGLAFEGLHLPPYRIPSEDPLDDPF